jgi:hypothetical protein
MANTLGMAELSSPARSEGKSWQEEFTPSEQAQLAALFAPLNPWFAQAPPQALCRDGRLDASSPLSPLVELVEELAVLLKSHGAAQEPT